MGDRRQASRTFQLTPGFTTELLGILTGSVNSTQCAGLAAAFDIAMGVIEDANGTPAADAIAPLVPDPYPNALQFGSNGAEPSHSKYVRQTRVGTLYDGANAWSFYSDIYAPPKPVRRPPPGRGRGPQ